MTNANPAPSDNLARTDQVDLIVSQWARERSDLDTLPMEVTGRLLRASRHIDSALHAVFKPFGLDFGLFDVLASLRRQGPPYQLPPSELNQWCMLSSGAMTKRLDRLEEAGLVMRKDDPDDRRGVLVVLTAAGLTLVDQVVVAHLENERRILAVLNPKQLTQLAAVLRTLLIHLEQTKA